ncbi:MAG: hypothetical protein ACI4V1_07130 [Eubacteriales bacterium]
MYEDKPYPIPKESGSEAADVLAEFALCMKRGDSPDSPAAQSAAEQWKNCQCTGCGGSLPGPESIPPEAETYGTGTTRYIADALEFYKGRKNAGEYPF